MSAPSDLFPCPFCRSTGVALIGQGGRFVHYRCGACAEVWTAMASGLGIRRSGLGAQELELGARESELEARDPGLGARASELEARGSGRRARGLGFKTRH